jgi:hydrogenase maturation protease
MHMRIKVVGLGHDMHGDDEIGLEVVRSWSLEDTERFSGLDIDHELLDNPGINLLGVIAGLDAAILVAAIHSGAPPGSIQIIKNEQLASTTGISRKGGGGGAAETLSLGQQIAPEDLPKTLILIGIEGASFGLGEGLSPAVQASIPEAVHVINQTLKRLIRNNNPIWRLVSGLIKRLSGFLGSEQ